MKTYLISPHKKQYKANLHCHSVLSDGKKTPEELKEMYKSHGYSILAITDHEHPAEHQELSEDGFVMLTGYEAHIRRAPKFNGYDDEIHMNLFAKDPHCVKSICFNDEYSTFMKRCGTVDKVEKVGSQRPREYSVEYINEFIKTANEHGYIVTYNHPCWSMQPEETVLAIDGIFSLEITNYSARLINGEEHNGMLYNKLLRAGKRIFCHGSDDNHNVHPLEHPHSDSFGVFTVVMPDRLDYDGVFGAISTGEMYSSMGPEIRELSVEDGVLHLECSDVSHVYMYYGNKMTRFLHAAEGESINSVDFNIDENAKFVRVAICDRQGRWADTRGYFPDEFRKI